MFFIIPNPFTCSYLFLGAKAPLGITGKSKWVSELVITQKKRLIACNIVNYTMNNTELHCEFDSELHCELYFELHYELYYCYYTIIYILLLYKAKKAKKSKWWLI